LTPLDIAVGLAAAAVLLAVAFYFARRQRIVLQHMRFDAALTKDHRRYLLKQCWRRFFSSLLLVILAVMLVGSLFLDYEPRPDVDREAARESVPFLIAYVIAMLLIVMAILLVAAFDFLATARFGVEQRKQLIQEHQELLAAELAQLRHRRADMN
jgi:hypothetical protein